MKTIMTVIGTRPEAIKLAPVLKAISKSKVFVNKVCVTRQHTNLLDPFITELGIVVDYQFENHKNNGSLHKSAAFMLEQFSIILKEKTPDLIIVQGDTTTAFVAALSAFYLGIPVAHVEAGLRTGNSSSPWPEETHRCLISKLTTYFFAPTEKARNALIKEGIASDKIWVVGNTSIDAIRLVKKPLKVTSEYKHKVIVVTIHRRENHGEPLIEICNALLAIAKEFFDVKIVFCLHPNPAVYQTVMAILSNVDNIDLILPMDHDSFIQLIDNSSFIITDSGGIQEEAAFLGKPILIIRNTTERPEGIHFGTAILVGTKSSNIIDSCRELIEDNEKLLSMSKVHFSYGDGYAAQRIVTILEQNFGNINS